MGRAGQPAWNALQFTGLFFFNLQIKDGMTSTIFPPVNLMCNDGDDGNTKQKVTNEEMLFFQGRLCHNHLH